MLERCRTCLVGIPDTSYVTLNKKDATTVSIRAELSACVPELQLNLVKDPVICRNCVSILQLAYTFKTRCLLTEKRIHSCLRNTKLNGKRVTLTKLFSFSMKTDSGSSCSGINGSKAKESHDTSSDIAAVERFLAKPERLSLDAEGNNDQQERTKDYITSTTNADSDVVMNSDISVIDSKDDNELQNFVTNRGAIVELPVPEFRENIFGSSSVFRCTSLNKDEISKDLHDMTDYDIVKEECDLSTFKIEAEEALNLKEENLNDEEERSNYSKAGRISEVSNIVAGDVNEETFQNVCDTDGKELVDGENQFPVPTRDDKHFDDNKSNNLHNQIKKCYVSVRRLCTNLNYISELYIHSTPSSDVNANANITEHKVQSGTNQNVNHEEERTNDYFTFSPRVGNNMNTVNTDEISQEIVDMDSDSIIKEERELETFKTEDEEELLNENEIRDYTINVDVPIKECFVKLSRLPVGLNDLMNKASFNINEFLNCASGKSLQNTTKKRKSLKEMDRNLSETDRVHSGKSSFCCNLCEYNTSIKKNLITHKRIHTEEKPFRCNICEFRTNKKLNLINHKRIHTGEKPFGCNVCEFRTAQKSNLITHKRIHTGEKPFLCNICDLRFTHKGYLRKHIRRHTGEKPFRCNICDLRFNDKGNLGKHIERHTGEKPFHCNVCEFRTAQKSDLIMHKRVHTGEKPFRCNICDLRMTKKANLVVHIRTHTGEKPFGCNVCEFRTAQKSNLIMHKRTHTGEKPFCCNICDLRFTDKGSLKKHIRTHTGEKPFGCNVCEFRTAQKSDLITHKRIHTGEKPFRCKICDLRMTKKAHLVVHIRTHTGEKPFGCNMCDLRFISQGTLNRHIHTHGRKTMSL